jgi:nitronate monooxygenase
MHFPNTLSSILQLNYPIVQAPMLGVSTPEMAAAASNEGALGSLAVGGLSPEATRQLIRQTKSLTNKPFAVNLFVHSIPDWQENDIKRMQDFLLQLAAEKGYPLSPEDVSDFHFHTYHEQLDILLQENIRLVSFTFGCLDNSSISLLKKNDCLLIGTATSVEEALFLQQQNIDMVTVQGIEAGGHRGSFIDNVPLPQIGLFALLPQIKQAVNIPCIAAGGINSAQTIQAAFALGADAVQIGTAFIGTQESIAITSYKERLTDSIVNDSALTRAFSGRWARGIRNEMMTAIEAAGIPIPPYPVQNSLTAKFRKLAQQANDSDYTNLWAGQSVSTTNWKTTKELINDLVAQYKLL